MSTVLLPPLLAGIGSVLLSILGVGFLIFVHELGHFLACRLTRTRVETFSIGFGPRLFGWETRPGQPRRFTIGRRREDAAAHAMDFRVAAIPLGGYVKMAGENPGEGRTGAADEFPSKPIGARVFVVSAGVIMNVLTAAAFYFVAFAGHVRQPPAVVGDAVTGGPAWEAGLDAGDRVLRIGGERIRSFIDLKMEAVFLEPGRPVPVEVDRGGERRTVSVTPRYDEENGAVLLSVSPPMGVRLVASDGRSLTVGSTDLVEVAGIPVRGGGAALDLLLAAWSARPARAVSVRRPGGETLELAFDADPTAAPTDWKIGIEPWGRPRVTAVRGVARGRIETGDRLLEAVTAAGRLALDRPSALERLAFHAPVTQFVVERSGAQVPVDLVLATPAAVHAFLADIALERPKDNVVAPIEPGTITITAAGAPARYAGAPARDAGLRPGESIVAIGQETVTSWTEILGAIGKLAGPAPLTLTVADPAGERRDLELTPVALQPVASGRLVAVDVTEPLETEGLLDAASLAVARTGREITNVFRMIAAFFTGNISFQRNVAGPATIVQFSSEAAETSFLTFLLFLAYISVTLAVLNILPIPILDGGHLLFMLIEKVRGTPLKDETVGRLQFVGLMLLLVLMFFAFKNDFVNLTSR